MVSIKDVAKHAGVAISTVSKVLNNYPNVSEETKKKSKSGSSGTEFRTQYRCGGPFLQTVRQGGAALESGQCVAGGGRDQYAVYGGYHKQGG